MNIADSFHAIWYGSHAWTKTKWRGRSILKNPFDMWIYQEILTELRPDVVIETGTMYGGSALFLADMLQLIHGTGRGKVISIDISPNNFTTENRIQYINGSSTDPLIVEKVKSIILPEETVVVILDSDHSADHVHNEMVQYSPLVTPGSYLIVEDTNLNGHPVEPGFGPGPAEAVERFLQNYKNFAHDTRWDHMLFTFNPGGYLRKRVEP